MLKSIYDYFFTKPEPPGPLICERCGHDEFYTGPCGGTAEMIECANCGTAYIWDGYNATRNIEADGMISGDIFDRKLEKL